MLFCVQVCNVLLLYARMTTILLLTWKNRFVLPDVTNVIPCWPYISNNGTSQSLHSIYGKTVDDVLRTVFCCLSLVNEMHYFGHLYCMQNSCKIQYLVVSLYISLSESYKIQKYLRNVIFNIYVSYSTVVSNFNSI